MSDPKRLIRGRGLGTVLLESGRAASPGPDDAQRDALWSRLAADLPGLGVGAGAGAALAAAGPKAAFGGAKAMGALAVGKGALVVVVATAIAAAGSVAALHWRGVHAGVVAVERAEAVPVTERTVIPPAAVGPVLELDPEVSAAAPAIAKRPPPRMAREQALVVRTSAPALSAAPVAPSPARGEAALLLDARTAVRSGVCDKALALVEEAQARFAAGSLAEEREVLFIQGLDCAGRKDEAEARRADFARAHPLSAYDVSQAH